MIQDAQTTAASTIFIVEDDDDTRELLDLAITSETPYRILSMDSAAEVLHRLEEVQAASPSLFLLDYRLPATTALELYDQLHSVESLAHTPAIILTAEQLHPEIARAFEERHATVIEKPFEIEHLLHSIHKLVQSRALIVE